MFNYVGSGNINLTGCYAAFKSINFKTKYTKGDVVFLKKKAKKGILESVAIKDVRILGGGFSSNQITAIYTDTYNFLYNEDELLYPNEAYELKNNYCILHSNFKHNSNVKINLHSCNGYDPQPPITTKFQIGDIVFLKKKAAKGILESIFIKNIKVLKEINCNKIYGLYLDNTNFYYNEDELINFYEANLLKEQYCLNNSNFKYTSNIEINLHSCNGYNPQPPITTKFQIGDVVFLKKKASMGILESIFIKSIKKLQSFNCKIINAIYLDNTNFYYNEDELVTELEAKNLMKEFVINKINALNNSKIKCGFKNIVAKCK